MHPLDHRTVLRGHQTGGLGAGDAERVDNLVGRKAERRSGAGRRREDADSGPRVPTLDDVLLTHAHADARTDLVACYCGGQEIAAAHSRPELGDSQEGRQSHRTDMQHTLAMDIVELEALHQGAVDEGGVRRGETSVAGPNAATGGAVDRRKRL